MNDVASATIASDIDGTLTGDPEALAELGRRVAAFRKAGGCFVLVTGRSWGQVLHGLADEGLPMPDAVITQVGTEIRMPPFVPEAPILDAWEAALKADYQREQAEAFVAGVPGAVLQPGRANTPLKASWWLDRCPDPEGAAEAVCRRVAANPGYRVIWSSGRDLDILPARAGKGAAVRFLLEHLGRDPEQCVVAGDTGNDLAMFQAFDKGVVVANAMPELRSWATASGGPGTYLAEQSYAAGVMEGLEALGVW